MSETYDVESVGNNAHGHELLSGVTAVHHERVGETLNDGALGLAETLGGIATGSVGEIDGLTDLNVVAEDGKKKYQQLSSGVCCAPNAQYANCFLPGHLPCFVGPNLIS